MIINYQNNLTPGSYYLYATEQAFLPIAADVLTIQKIEQEYTADSLLEFFYQASNKHNNFKGVKAFLSYTTPKDVDPIEFVLQILKHLVYPLEPVQQISTTTYLLTEGWRLVLLFDEPIAFFRVNEDTGKTFIALSQESSAEYWGQILTKNNFFDLLKSRLIEELINAKIFG